MTPLESFVGSLIEISSLMLLLRFFSVTYINSKWRFFFIVIVSSIIVVLSEYFELPVIVKYIVILLIEPVMISLIYHRKLWFVFFEVLLANAIIVFFELLLIFLYSFIQPNPLEFWERLLHLMILLCVCIYLSGKNSMLVRSRIFYEKYYKSLYFIIINISAIALLQLIIWDTNHPLVYENSGFLSFITILWFVLNLYLLKVMISDQQKKTIVQAYRQYEEMAETLLNDLFAQKHEYKRHLQAILRMCEAEEIKKTEIIEYIAAIKSQEVETSKQIISVNTGSGLINGLIYSKILEAESEGISLTYVGDSQVPHFPCFNFELVELIGNLLDNAIEYLMEVKDQKEKKIFIEIGKTENQIFIKIRNSYYGEAEVEKFVRKGQSTKTGPRRGYGLYNVKQLVSKYKGNIFLFSKEQYLHIEIYFNNSEGQSTSP